MGALAGLLESLSAWSGRSVHAVLDADASDVQAHPERWAEMLSQVDGRHVAVEWVALPRYAPRDRFLGRLGDFRHASRLVSLGAGGVR
jgi:Mg-chelatase subunit ChlI